MMMKNRHWVGWLLGTLLFLLGLPGFTQDFGQGAVLDSERYNSLPEKAELSLQAYAELPEAVSLKEFSPIPGDQKLYGTCVGWATAYAARTISESVILNRRHREATMDNAFSPVFIYKNISDDPECQTGTSISAALDLMKAEGAARMIEVERSVDFPKVPLTKYKGTRKYPIAGYVVLYHAGTRRGSRPTHVQMVKQSLAEGKPVIIGMNTPDSFIRVVGEVWRPRESPGSNYGGHAMCVVGYDDTKYGGAFEVQNSWGKKWGNGGYIWIPYDAFTQWVTESYEIIENPAYFSE